MTFSSSTSRSAASSATVGRRPSCPSRRPRALVTRVSRSPAWTGSRTVRPVLAMPRVMAWRIHQVA